MVAPTVLDYPLVSLLRAHQELLRHQRGPRHGRDQAGLRDPRQEAHRAVPAFPAGLPGSSSS
eukprot:3559395-Lingulodinium_polyedra.AAC.1